MRRLWLVLGLVARLVTPQHLQTTLHWTNTTLVAAFRATDAVRAILASALSLQPTELQVRSVSMVAASDVTMILWLPYSYLTMAALQRRYQIAVAGHIVHVIMPEQVESDAAQSRQCLRATPVVPLDMFLSNTAWPRFQTDVEAYVRAPVALVDVTGDSFTLCVWTSRDAAAVLSEYLVSQTTGLAAVAARPTPLNLSLASAPTTGTEHDCQGSLCVVLHWSVPSALLLTAPTELAPSTTLVPTNATHVRDGDMWLVSTTDDDATVGLRCLLASTSGPIDLTWAAARPLRDDDDSASSVLTPLVLPDNWSAHLTSEWYDTHLAMTIALSPPMEKDACDAACVALDACLAALVDWPLLRADLRAMDPSSRADLTAMFASCDAASWHQWYLSNAHSVGASVAFLLTPAQQSLDVVQTPGVLHLQCNNAFSEVSYATAESLARDVAAVIAECTRGDDVATDTLTLTYPSAYLGPTLWMASDSVVVHSTPASLVAIAVPS